jgi:hypothetical protein
VVGPRLDSVLASHRLPAEADGPLTTDDFDAILTWRLEHLARLLADKTGRAEQSVHAAPAHLRTLDGRIEEVELGLRQLIAERLNAQDDQLPERVLQSVRDRIDSASRKQPGLARQSWDLATRLQYFDLRELEQTIVAKPLWPKFSDLFTSKESLAMRFGQLALAELRNAIRHSREVTSIMRNDGEAAIGWFTQAMAGARADERG